MFIPAGANGAGANVTGAGAKVGGAVEGAKGAKVGAVVADDWLNERRKSDWFHNDRRDCNGRNHFD